VNETWLSPCLTAKAELDAVSKAKVAHSVGTLEMVRSTIVMGMEE